MLHNPQRQLATEWRRLRMLFGIPSTILVLGVLFTQSTINIIIGHLSLRGDLIWLASLAAAGMFLFSRYQRSYAASTRRATSVVRDESLATRLANKRGLIAVLGLDSAHADSELAMLLGQLPHLEYLVLLGSPETHALGVADLVTHQLLAATGHSIDGDHRWVFEQGDAGSMADFDLATRQATSWLLHRKVRVDEILCDVTAGKRAMGFGVLLAADQAGIEVQYLDSGWDHVAKSKLPGSLNWKVAREATTS